ncbi:hypothetical protein GCM10027402_30160 [Arthrobacter monumenti]
MAGMPERPERPADAGWLSLRMPADDKARGYTIEPLIGPLVEWLRPSAQGDQVNVVDLGAGTGSNAHWLAPRLPFAQHWTLVDHDAHLLSRADPPASFTGRTGKMEDVGRILAEASADGRHPPALVTCSALLDVLTDADIEAICSAATEASCAVLFSLTVTGQVEFTPAEPLDLELAKAFDDHQRREGRLGPDAAAAAHAALARHGLSVTSVDTPWELDSSTPDLFSTWVDEWVEAALEQEPALASEADAWLGRRLAQLRQGELSVRVEHQDLLALPR